MSEKKIDQYTDQELQDVWNAIGKCFEQGRGIQLTIRYGFGFIQLSRETARRGLEMEAGRMGQIILKKADRPYPVLKS